MKRTCPKCSALRSGGAGGVELLVAGARTDGDQIHVMLGSIVDVLLVGVQHNAADLDLQAQS